MVDAALFSLIFVFNLINSQAVILFSGNLLHLCLVFLCLQSSERILS